MCLLRSNADKIRVFREKYGLYGCDRNVFQNVNLGVNQDLEFKVVEVVRKGVKMEIWGNFKLDTKCY